MSAELSSRERVLRAIARRGDIDRVPIIFRAEPLLMRRLREQLRLDSDLAVLRHFACDALQVSAAYRKGARQEADANGTFTDIFGNRYQSIRHGELESYSVIEPLLASATSAADVAVKRWPTAEIVDTDECLRRARAARESGLAVYGGIWASLFTTARSILGEEHFLLCTIDNPELVRAVINRLTNVYLDLNRAYLQACAKEIDVYYFGSDLGTQRSMFMSAEMCRQFILPGLKRLAQQAKEFGLPVMYHTCGAVSGIIDDLAECGIDALDPVQVSAAGMAPQELQRFKGRIAFHGAISTQTTLPFATPGEVEEATRQTLATLGPQGLIAGPDQEMIGDIPVANIEAMSRAICQFKL